MVKVVYAYDSLESSENLLSLIVDCEFNVICAYSLQISYKNLKLSLNTIQNKNQYLNIQY